MRFSFRRGAQSRRSLRGGGSLRVDLPAGAEAPAYTESQTAFVLVVSLGGRSVRDESRGRQDLAEVSDAA